MTAPRPSRPSPSFALLSLAAGAFGIGVTEFVIMGLLMEVGTDLHVSIAAAGMLIFGYALGVVVGAPVLTIATSAWSRRRTLLALMAIFIVGNAACAIAPTYAALMVARIITAFAHGTFFGVGSVAATRLVAPDRRAHAIAVMFTGLTIANVLGVPFGTWLGQQAGWRATFWAVAVMGIVALAIIAAALPADRPEARTGEWRDELAVLLRGRVVLGLATTVLGYAGVFAVFTYIAPLLTEITGFGRGSISTILLLFGGGLVVGNLAGGKAADRWLEPAVVGSLALLALVLLAAGPLLTSRPGTLILVAALGFAAFATVAPLQMWVMTSAHGVGESLVSSVNIAAFNLGNALGAAAGGVALTSLGLASLTWVAALFPLTALGLAFAAMRPTLKRRIYS